MDEEKFIVTEEPEIPAEERVVVGEMVAADVAEAEESGDEEVEAANDAEVAAETVDGDSRRPTPEEVESLIEAAREEGYLRGRNERIEQLMAEPGLFEATQRRKPEEADKREILILNNLRKSVWDNE